MIALVFTYGRPDGVFVDPPFNHKNVCIHAVGYGQERVNPRTKDAKSQENYGKNHQISPR